MRSNSSNTSNKRIGRRYPWIAYVRPGIPHGELELEGESAADRLIEALGLHAKLFHISYYNDPGHVPGQVVIGDAGQVLVGDEGTAMALEFALANHHDLDGGLMRVVVELSRYPVPGALLEMLVEKFKRLRRQLEWRDDQIDSFVSGKSISALLRT
jgi:hypothetical protein